LENGRPNMTLTRADIIKAVAEQSGMPKFKSIEAVETLLETISSTLEAGEDVLISGFGKFCVKEKTARMGRNPATTEPMMVAPRRVITFKCSIRLREKLNR